VITTIANDFPIAGLAVDTDGSVLAADARWAGRIVRIDTTGSSNATTVVASSLGLVRGLAVGTDGSIYFASSQTSPPTAADWYIFRLRPVP
jgi:glucose/arabinose dehydrogenase